MAVTSTLDRVAQVRELGVGAQPPSSGRPQYQHTEDHPDSKHHPGGDRHADSRQRDRQRRGTHDRRTPTG